MAISPGSIIKNEETRTAFPYLKSFAEMLWALDINGTIGSSLAGGRFVEGDLRDFVFDSFKDETKHDYDNFTNCYFSPSGARSEAEGTGYRINFLTQYDNFNDDSIDTDLWAEVLTGGSFYESGQHLFVERYGGGTAESARSKKHMIGSPVGSIFAFSGYWTKTGAAASSGNLYITDASTDVLIARFNVDGEKAGASGTWEILHSGNDKVFVLCNGSNIGGLGWVDISSVNAGSRFLKLEISAGAGTSAWGMNWINAGSFVSGAFVSNVIASTTGSFTSATPVFKVKTNPGTTFTNSLSADSGGNFDTTNDNTWVDFTNEGSEFVLKVEAVSISGNEVSALERYGVQYV